MLVDVEQLIKKRALRGVLYFFRAGNQIEINCRNASKHNLTHTTINIVQI